MMEYAEGGSLYNGKSIEHQISEVLAQNTLFSYPSAKIYTLRERSGSVVECLTRRQGAAGSSLTGITWLLSLSKTHLS